MVGSAAGLEPQTPAGRDSRLLQLDSRQRQENKPWDQFAREIFTGTGSTRQNGALNYFVLHKDPIELTENVTQAFLGQRLTCARCHNHPLEKWTQKQYYQMANLFSRVGIKNGDDPGESIVFAKTSGDINHPRLLRPLAPTPLDGECHGARRRSDRRVHFANWLTSPKNDMFARDIVNRVWGNFMGHGIVDPIDDVRATNPPRTRICSPRSQRISSSTGTTSGD